MVAAIKNPEKKAGALDLILELISNEEICLVGNDLLLLEFERYSEKLRSKTASYLIKRLKDKMVSVSVGEEYIKNCSMYFSKTNIVDIVHAATCLQENSILITNDKHFDKISKSGIIEVWSISKAIEALLSKR
ncbi:MAG: PIN domain-containing protein [Candidatus Methanoperedens sp.]|nr:PIN domain-containing protein [Candidatus Methanoperedens sp.]